ncbi:related to rRNA-processing protein EFG1 [Armillaria ostoyae]|uniref:rRNA-processing protein EFG1 n=1 Tax=Armillaria ostoyae TaxID=47428 RepID=A0A284QNT1_ARMOS|nr:related to rRNA-processing protein EFG1 [Armillaria ostoyae]
MAPSRTSKATRKSHRPDGGGGQSGTPGVQKIKSSLRQTRRLLAKDNLAADVRVTTERRLKALEAELAEAEQIRKERALGMRYHGVKFFERQKVLRKVKQVKKKLSSIPQNEKKALESSLFDARVDLNYILHYPKTKKYISLFPPEIRHPETQSNSTDSSETNAQRQQIKDQIRQQMLDAELPLEPELHLSTDTDTLTKKRVAKPSKFTSVPVADAEQDDDFFGDDDEADDEGS